MLKLRYYIRLFQAFIGRFKVLLVLGIVFGILFFSFLFFLFPILFSGNTETIGYTGRFTTDNLPKPVLSYIGEGLTQVDSTGIVKPALARSWESADQGKTWIFHLNTAKSWQDGKKITSDSLVYNFDDVTIERPNSETIIFHLKERFSPFPSVVSTPIFKKGFLGTGQWKVTKLTLAGNFVENMVLEDKEKNKKIIKFFPTEEQTKLAFKLGQVNKLVDILDPSPLNSWSISEVTGEAIPNRYVAVFFNTDKDSGSPFADKKLRQALAYAIDKDVLGENRALGPISPDSWAYNSQIKDYKYDIRRAKELLGDVDKEIKEKPLVLSTSTTLLPVAEKIAKNWEEVGLKVNISVVQGIPTDYQAFLAIYDSSYDPDQYITWHSSQAATNISRYKDDRIDKLLEDGRLETDLNERKKIYLDFQRYLLEDAPAVFLYHPISYTIIRK
jgi:peptide/nickel transport system substrate-binding protein